MRRVFPFLAVALAALAFAAAPAAAMSFEEARHLASRTGFAPALDDVLRLQPMTRDQAVDWLLANARATAVTPPPEWTKAAPRLRPASGATPAQRRAFWNARRDDGLSLRAWWYAEMARTPSPLTERMTLFWHNHFSSSLRKVKSPQLMYRQNLLLRGNALGSFRDLVHGISKDPAMLIYLDNIANRAGAPNRTFAAALLGRFTLGDGHYTERDVKEAARAFTGWGVDPDTGEFEFRVGQHDKNIKAVLWESGHLNGDAVINIILEKDRVAVLITGKMWRAFISETPDGFEVRRIAAAFEDSNYDIKTLLGTLLKSKHFWDRRNRGRLIKSPAELIAGALRQFRIGALPGRMLRHAGQTMGQDLFAPPTTEGWPGGTGWITANSLLLRQRLLRRMTRPIRRIGAGKGQRPTARADLDRWMQTIPVAQRRPGTIAALLLPVKPVKPQAASADPTKYVRGLLLDPAYQLK